MTLPVALAVVFFGVAVGVLSALFGIGGGLVMVPFMVLLLESSQHLAEGTSLLVIVPTAIAGVIAHTRRGFVDFRAAGWLALGGVIGAFIGARIALASPGATLQIYFAVFLILMGARLIRDGYKARSNPEPANPSSRGRSSR
ncbi:MAG: sulfite exporter TauE/SafE family protein [Actinomycetota bacterium]|nr:sulfite exporter TauE/SafE family protein [Actinomycetota bacterium]